MKLARAAHRWLARRAVSLPLLAALSWLFLSPLFAKPMHLGHGDWLWFHFTWDAARKTLLGFHELPVWNPYYCGGTVGLENPQSVALSPVYWALLPLPTALAMKAYLVVMTFIGASGTFELLRLLRAHAFAALVGAVLFACSGALGWHLNGQLSMAAFGFLPWAMLGLELSLRRAHPLGPWCTGAAMALMVLSGGVYPAALSSVALVVRVVGATGARLRGGAVLGSSAVIAVGLAAAKLVPMSLFLGTAGRPIAADDRVSPGLLPAMLLARRTTETQLWDRAGGHLYAWWGEYGNYVGWLGLALVTVSLVSSSRRARPWLIGLALCFALVFGDHGPASPYHLLRSLPVFSSLRVPTRFWMVANLFLAVSVALGLSRLLRRGHRVAPKLAVALLALGTCVDLVWTNGISVFRGAMVTSPAPRDEGPRAMRTIRHPAHRMVELPPQNLGTPACWDEVRVPGSPALRVNAPSEVWLATQAGEAELIGWTPSTATVHVRADVPTVVFVNQNAAPGWTVDGAPVTPHAGLVAASVLAGDRVLHFRRRAPGLAVGGAWTLATLVAGVWTIARWRRVRRAERPRARRRARAPRRWSPRT